MIKDVWTRPAFLLTYSNVVMTEISKMAHPASKRSNSDSETPVWFLSTTSKLPDLRKTPSEEKLRFCSVASTRPTNGNIHPHLINFVWILTPPEKGQHDKVILRHGEEEKYLGLGKSHMAWRWSVEMFRWKMPALRAFWMSLLECILFLWPEGLGMDLSHQGSQ